MGRKIKVAVKSADGGVVKVEECPFTCHWVPCLWLITPSGLNLSWWRVAANVRLRAGKGLSAAPRRHPMHLPSLI